MAQENVVRVLVVAATTLALLASCSDRKEDLMPAGLQKQFEQSAQKMTKHKALIGTTYRVAGPQPVRLRFLPSSLDKVELTEGDRFRIENLIVNRMDLDDLHYALKVYDGGELYLSVREFQKLIDTRAVYQECPKAGRG